MTPTNAPIDDDATLPLEPLAPPSAGRLRVVPLGGLGEFGKNCMVFEYGDDLVVLDCGLKFPEDEMFGVDMVIPDFTYVRRSLARFRGLVLTHGHEDHIGAVPFFVREMSEPGPVPVYGSHLTLALVREKLAEHGAEHLADLREVADDDRFRIGALDVETLSVEHSMPSAFAVVFHLPEGDVLHTGDFKIYDWDAIDEPTGLMEYIEQTEPGKVLLLLSDSTNVDRDGRSPTEDRVRDGLAAIFARAPRAVILATFSSSLHRVATVLQLAREFSRKVAICGYSLERNFDIARRLGLIRGFEDVLVSLNELQRFPPDERLLLTTGTQGEPMSALSRLALNAFRGYKVAADDLVVLSSRIIPGNEKGIYRMINHFYRRGARVITERDAPVHASGHAYREEMLDLLEGLRPRYLVPIHGELRQLIGHRDLALEAGVDPGNIFVLEDGQELLVDPFGAATSPPLHAGQVLVDGKVIDGVDEVVLRDRKHLSNDGMLTVILVIDKASHRIMAGPDIVSRGFVLMDQSEDLIEACKQVVVATFDATDTESQEEWDVVKHAVRKALRKFLAAETDRYPVILPVVVEI